MLVTFVNVVSCENPQCREFGKIPVGVPRMKFYYCPVCGTVSASRTVDSELASSPERYECYLRQLIQPRSENNGTPSGEGTRLLFGEQAVGA
ncbi:MAG: hypothetical protein ACP5R5_11170 [Armatimonadota bacterium]